MHIFMPLEETTNLPWLKLKTMKLYSLQTYARNIQNTGTGPLLKQLKCCLYKLTYVLQWPYSLWVQHNTILERIMYTQLKKTVKST
jgi:hypothetical protein